MVEPRGREIDDAVRKVLVGGKSSEKAFLFPPLSVASAETHFSPPSDSFNPDRRVPQGTKNILAGSGWVDVVPSVIKPAGESEQFAKVDIVSSQQTDESTEVVKKEETLNPIDKFLSNVGKHPFSRKLAAGLAALSMAAGAHFFTPSEAEAASCQFVLGFKTMHDAVPQVGDCLDNQSFAPNGDATQHTTGGLLVWRKADNWTAFTNGSLTWVNGPYGIQVRPNNTRFPYEHDTQSATTPVAIATEAPTATATATAEPATPTSTPEINSPHVLDLSAWNSKDESEIQGVMDQLSGLNLNITVDDYKSDDEIYSTLSDADKANLSRFVALMKPKELINATSKVIPMVAPHYGTSWVIPGNDYFELASDVVEGRTYNSDTTAIILPAISFKEMLYLVLVRAGAQNPEKISLFAGSLEIKQNTKVGQPFERDAYATQERNFAKTAQPYK